MSNSLWSASKGACSTQRRRLWWRGARTLATEALDGKRDGSIG